MKTKVCFALMALAAMATSARAAKLVVVAVNAIAFDENSADVVQPFVNNSSPPTATAPAGAKGFVIGIDNTADPQDPATPTGPGGQAVVRSGHDVLGSRRAAAFADSSRDAPPGADERNRACQARHQ